MAQLLHCSGNCWQLLTHGPGTPGQRSTATHPALVSHALGGRDEGQLAALVLVGSITLSELAASV